MTEDKKQQWDRLSKWLIDNWGEPVDSVNEKDEKKRLKKWNQIPEIQTQDEYMDFIKQSLNNRNIKNKKIKIGETTEDSRRRIGRNVKNIGIDNSGIIHAHGKINHNLESNDLLHAVDVINNADTVSNSNRKHQDNDVVSFIKDINGNLELLATIHEPKDFLMIFDAWRKKKVRSSPDAAFQPPGAHVQDATQPTNGPAGNDTYARDLASTNTGNTQSINNIPHFSPEINSQIDYLVHRKNPISRE